VARETNRNDGACKQKFPLKKQRMTNFDKVITDKPYSMTELIITDNMYFKFFPTRCHDEGPEISGKRELKHLGPQ